jgi:cytochrome P450
MLRTLPYSWTASWLPCVLHCSQSPPNLHIIAHSLSIFSHIWYCGHEPFKRVGADTFIIVSPGGNVLWTCDADVIMQLSTRPLDFKKPVDILGMLNIYGPTITAAEGPEHRVYRKIAAPSFGEATHWIVWSEALRQSQRMLEHWGGDGGEVGDVSVDARKLALHVLSKALFGKEMRWEGGEVVPAGQSMSYSEAIGGVFKHCQTLFMIPHAVLRERPLSPLPLNLNPRKF